MEQDMETHIQIVAFCCRYCAYAAADLAGVLRLHYPPDIRIVQLPCTGRLDTLEVLHTLEHGADAVMVAGCLEGDCHFQKGNLEARTRVNRIKEILNEIGLNPERVEMFNMSAAMGNKFAEAATAFSERITALGPSPLRADSKEIAEEIKM
jgi:F420-non-reducing hydrogenase iron-sulfur subunit